MAQRRPVNGATPLQQIEQMFPRYLDANAEPNPDAGDAPVEAAHAVHPVDDQQEPSPVNPSSISTTASTLSADSPVVERQQSPAGDGDGSSAAGAGASGFRVTDGDASDAGSDDDEADKKDIKKGKKGQQQRRRQARSNKKAKRGSDDEYDSDPREESDEGDFDDREMDYISSDSSSDADTRAPPDEQLKGVADEDALRTLVQSESEEEDEDAEASAGAAAAGVAGDAIKPDPDAATKSSESSASDDSDDSDLDDEQRYRGSLLCVSVDICSDPFSVSVSVCSRVHATATQFSRRITQPHSAIVASTATGSRGHDVLAVGRVCCRNSHGISSGSRRRQQAQGSESRSQSWTKSCSQASQERAFDGGRR